MPELPITDAQLQPQLVPGLLVGVGPNQPFIGEQVLNAVSVDAQDFFYDTFDNFAMTDEGVTKRGLHSHSKILTPPTTGTKRGYADEYSSKTPLDVNIIAAAEAADRNGGLRPSGLSRADRRRQASMAKLVFNEKIQREKEAAAVAFTQGNYDSGLRTTALAYKTMKIGDIKDAMALVQARTGYLPDTWVMGRLARTSLDENANFLDRINGGATSSDPAVITDNLLASLVGVKRVLVGNSLIQPKTLPGVLAASSTAIWTADSAALVVTGDAETTDEYTMAFGKTFYVNVPGTGLRFGAWSWLDDEPNTMEWQKIAEYRLIAQTSQAGYLMENCDQ